MVEPRFKRRDLDEMDYNELKNYAECIFNTSLEAMYGTVNDDYLINNRLYEYENKLFNLSDEINVLLHNKIHYVQVLNLIDENSVVNLRWLKTLMQFKDYREELSLHFPIEKVVIAEGITEEILLPVFAKILGYDFYKKGIQIISAGGKNQVVKLFYTLSEQLKVPIFVLLDNDARVNYEQIMKKLRPQDSIHLLSGGEFEDILPKNLILKTLNDHFKNLNSIDEADFVEERMVKNLEEIFKLKGFHEFKKAEFAQLIKEHISSVEDVPDEIKAVIKELSSSFFELQLSL